MVNKIFIPDENKDIVLSGAGKSILKIVLTIIWYALGIVTAIYYNSHVTQLFKNIYIISAMIILILLYIAFPIKVLGIHKVLSDKNWTGVITDKKFYQKYDLVFKPIDIVALYIKRNDNAETIKMTFKKSNYEPGNTYYNIGDEVIHYKGVKYMKKVHSDGKKNICLICGILNSSEKEKCPCGHTILKTE